MCIDILAVHGTAASAYMLATLLHCGGRQRLKCLHAYDAHVELSCPLRHLGCPEMQLRLHSFEHKKFQERLIGNIALVGQRLELL